MPGPMAPMEALANMELRRQARQHLTTEARMASVRLADHPGPMAPANRALVRMDSRLPLRMLRRGPTAGQRVSTARPGDIAALQVLMAHRQVPGRQVGALLAGPPVAQADPTVLGTSALKSTAL